MLSSDLRSRDAVLWFWLPVVFFIGWWLFEYNAPEAMVIAAVAENGFLEVVQVALAFIASIAGLRILCTIDARRYPWLQLWFVLATFTCIYIVGEEISWGQWIFFWETPESWMALNDQGETNLHNTSSWLDQKPRTVLEIGVVIGGLIMPWLFARKPERFNTFWRAVMPSHTMYTLAILFIIIKIIDRIGDFTGERLLYRASELVETYLYYFMMLYIVMFQSKAYARIRR